MRIGGKSDDPSALSMNQRRPKSAGELEMAEMVDGELRLMFAPVARQRGGRHTGAVDQDVQRALRNRSAKASIEAGSSRSMVANATSGISARFAIAFDISRVGTMTLALADRKARTVSTPIPE